MHISQFLDKLAIKYSFLSFIHCILSKFVTRVKFISEFDCIFICNSSSITIMEGEDHELYNWLSHWRDRDRYQILNWTSVICKLKAHNVAWKLTLFCLLQIKCLSKILIDTTLIILTSWFGKSAGHIMSDI